MVCGDGDAVFPDQIALDRHMKGHKEDYSCPICQKQYSTKQSLGRHKTIHANIQIPCTLCDKKFKSKPCMVRLIRTCTEKIHMTFLIIFFTFHILKFLTVIYNFVHIAWFNVQVTSFPPILIPIHVFYKKTQSQICQTLKKMLRKCPASLTH